MTQEEIDESFDCAKTAALTELKNELADLMVATDGESGSNALDDLHFELETVLKRMTKLKERRMAGWINWPNLMRVLTLPVRKSFSCYSGEMERDPISGNKRPQMTQFAVCYSEARVGFNKVRQDLAKFVGEAMKLAEEKGSPSFAGWRQVWLTVYPLAEDEDCRHFLDGETADELLEHLRRLMTEFRADLAYAAFKKTGKVVQHAVQ